MKKLFFLLFFLPLLTHAQVIVTVAGTGSYNYSGDGGPAIDAALREPYGVNVDDSGNLYICDLFNYCIRKVSPGYYGNITTIAGNGTAGYSGDGGLGINAQLNGAIDVAIDRHGNVYIADEGNNCIRKVTPADTITTIAGTGVAGYNGDGMAATAAQLNIPRGVIIDSIGNIYIVDGENFRIRKVDTTGIITTIAGTGIAGFSPDGSRVDTAQLDSLGSIRIDKAGNLFLGDNVRIRRIDTAGIISTVAGNGIIGYSGDSGLATAAEIGGGAIAIDNAGNLFIADEGANRIREVNTGGIIYTIAGNGFSGFGGDGGSPLLARLCSPQGVAVNNSGDVYIGDVCNNRVRVVTTHPLELNSFSNLAQSICVYPNPCQNHCTIQINSIISEQTQIIITNVTGTEVSRLSIYTNQPSTIQSDWPPGIYIISATTEHEHFTGKIIIY